MPSVILDRLPVVDLPCRAHAPPRRGDHHCIEEIIVASVCDVCGKGPGFGKSVSHSHVRSNRRWNPNIQRVRALVNGTPRHLNVCTTCLKSDRVVRAI